MSHLQVEATYCVYIKLHTRAWFAAWFAVRVGTEFRATATPTDRDRDVRRPSSTTVLEDVTMTLGLQLDKGINASQTQAGGFEHSIHTAISQPSSTHAQSHFSQRSCSRSLHRKVVHETRDLASLRTVLLPQAGCVSAASTTQNVHLHPGR